MQYMKKLYEVEMTVYVMAANEIEAHEAATDFEVEIPFADCEIYEAGAVNSSWMEAIPYGSDDDKTCREILANNQLQPTAEKRGG